MFSCAALSSFLNRREVLLPPEQEGPPDIVRRSTDLKQGPNSLRQVQRDMRTLERTRLISHVRRGNSQTNKYQFLWHLEWTHHINSLAEIILRSQGRWRGEPEEPA